MTSNTGNYTEDYSVNAPDLGGSFARSASALLAKPYAAHLIDIAKKMDIATTWSGEVVRQKHGANGYKYVQSAPDTPLKASEIVAGGQAVPETFTYQELFNAETAALAANVDVVAEKMHEIQNAFSVTHAKASAALNNGWTQTSTPAPENTFTMSPTQDIG